MQNDLQHSVGVSLCSILAPLFKFIGQYGKFLASVNVDY